VSKKTTRNKAYGPHLQLDASSCSRKKLDSIAHIYNVLDEFPEVIGMTKIAPPRVQKVPASKNCPEGISGFVIIAESHISIHAYSEIGYLLLDIFSCRDFDVGEAISFAQEKFEFTEYKINFKWRGEDYPHDVAAASNINLREHRRAGKKIGSC